MMLDKFDQPQSVINGIEAIIVLQTRGNKNAY